MSRRPCGGERLGGRVRGSVRGRPRYGGREDEHIAASARTEREAGEGGNVYGEEGVAAMTRPVFDVAAERRRWRPCLGRYGFGKISLAAYARMIFERPGVLGRRRQTLSRYAAIVGKDPRPALKDVAGREREERV